ncbi:MAG: ribosome assembly cofactor RimP [Muribaculaceae bacterium]|nr:ribosome assembly cofactor RimP [Muribaculaceae bacterium]
MIDKELLERTVADAIEGTDAFIVDINVGAGNAITVEIDSPAGVDIDTCADITRKIEAVFYRDVEDYDLEVGSAGLTAPFKVKGQFDKNVGNDVEVLTRDGRKLSGRLVEVNADGSEFVIEVTRKVKVEGKKRPELIAEPLRMAVADTKYVKYLINFK